MTGPKLGTWDFVAIVLYFMAVIGAGIFAMCRSRRNTVSSYFLAGRFMTWLPVGASLFASNIGSEHFIGLAGSGAASGIAVGAFELNACFLLQFLGWVFLPVYIASGVCTLPEYIKKRFGGERIRVYLAVLSVMLYVFTKISVNLYSGALFIQQALDWNLYISVLLLLALTALTTVTGGLAAVIYTDTLQAFVMIFGACLLTILSLMKVGGYSELYRRYMLAIPSTMGATNGLLTVASDTNLTFMTSLPNSTTMTSNITDLFLPSFPFSNNSNVVVDAVTFTTAAAAAASTAVATATNKSLAAAILECGRPRPDSWYMLRDASDPDMPWPGFLLGQTPASIWYWCADQMIVQRTLAAKSLSHAQGSTLLAGYLKILPVFILVMPGMISRVLFTDEVACVDPDVCMKVCQNKLGCSNIAFPKLVLEIMPTGLKGIMMSVMLAALVSDLTSIFNSASTLFTMDVYRNLRKGARNRELMIVGRVFVGLMVIVGILWIPVVQNMQGAQLFIYIQSVSAYLAPPIASVYLLAILWKRANEKGSFYALMIGLVIGSIRMTLNFVYPDPLCGQPDDRPWIVSGVHYMYFAFALFILTTLIVIVVSLATERPTENQIAQTTYWTRFTLPIPTCTLTTNEGHKQINGGAHGPENPSSQIISISEGRSLLGELPNEKGENVEVKGNLEVKDKVKENLAAEKQMSDEVVEVVDVVLKELKPFVKKQVTIVAAGQGGNPKPHSLITQCMGWFCGLSSTEEAVAESCQRVEEIRFLKQTKKEKRLLISFLILLLIINIFLYIFFSTGSDFWLLRSPPLATSSSNQ